MVYLLKMVIFHGYVSLPEGNLNHHVFFVGNPGCHKQLPFEDDVNATHVQLWRRSLEIAEFEIVMGLLTLVPLGTLRYLKIVC